MNIIYKEFSKVYDSLMYDYDYENIYEYIREIFKREKINPKNILEMACGTASLSLFLRREYDVVAFDKSDEMLSQAYEKVRRFKNIQLLKGDLRDFSINKSFGAVLCLCDSLNYLLKEEDLLQALKVAYNQLEEGGVFIFDLNSKYYFENVLAQNIFCDDMDEVYYVWQNNYDKNTMLNYYNVDFFIKDESGKYERVVEEHIERSYDQEFVKKALLDCGFVDVKTYNNYTVNDNLKEAVRIVYVAKRGGK